jgi:hypothetical protein
MRGRGALPSGTSFLLLLPDYMPMLIIAKKSHLGWHIPFTPMQVLFKFAPLLKKEKLAEWSKLTP